MCADTSQSLLNVNALSVKYGKTSALSNFDLSLCAGDTLGLLGLNGAGKSSLLKVIAGVLAPAMGSVSINGADMRDDPITARQQIGYAPDKPPVYPEFTIEEYLKFTAQIRRIPGSKIKASIDRALEKCDLTDVRSRIIGNLSHGYQQRTNLAQALIHQPKVLILDEPGNGLDPAQLIEMRTLITTIQDQQATLFSTHLLTEVQATCNRVVVVNRGLKLLDMPIDQLDSQHHNTYEVVLQEAARHTDMESLPGVVNACSVDAQRWLLTTKASNSTSSGKGIGEALTARGHCMLELKPVRDHLETMFSQLKSSAQSSAAPIGEPA